MPIKPYSFRYPYDIQTSWEAMEKIFTSPVRGLDPEYITMLARMRDRDRALEDHVNLEVGQGILGRASATTIQTGIAAVDTDVNGLTVTATIPAGRLIKITAHLMIDNEAGVTAIGRATIYEDGAIVEQRESYLDANGGLREASDIDWFTFTTPAAGQHTWKLAAAISSANGRIFATATRRSMLFVEDVGPAN